MRELNMGLPDAVSDAKADALVASANDGIPVTALTALWRHRGWVLMGLDFVVVVAMFLLAYFLRFHLQFMAIKYVAVQAIETYLKGAAVLGALWVFFLWRAGAYRVGLSGWTLPALKIRAVFLAGAKALAVLMSISFMYRGLLLSRQVYLMTGVFAVVMLMLIRLLMNALRQDLAAQGMTFQRVLMAGVGVQALEFAERLGETRSTLKVIGFVNEPSAAVAGGSDGKQYPVLGTLADIETIYERTPFDKIVASHTVFERARDEGSAGELIRIVNFCEARGVSLYMLPNVLNVAVNQDEVGAFCGMPLVKMRDAALRPGYAVVKRVMDIAIAFTVLTLGAPLWVAIAIVIKWTSKGPVLYIQERVGLHGRPYPMYKFRSMVAGADAQLKELVDFDKMDEPVFNIKSDKDPRVTWIGRALRRTSLDEIPQLLNVLKGEMSVIGPRPERVELVAKYNAWQRRRLKAKPGITGLQQVMRRGDPSLAVRIKYDLIYLKHESLFMDLYILFKTVYVVIWGTGVNA